MKSYDEMLFGILAVARSKIGQHDLEELEAELGDTPAEARASLAELCVERGLIEEASAAKLMKMTRGLDRDASFLFGRLVVEEGLVTVGEVESALRELSRMKPRIPLGQMLQRRQVLTAGEVAEIDARVAQRLGPQTESSAERAAVLPDSSAVHAAAEGVPAPAAAPAPAPAPAPQPEPAGEDEPGPSGEFSAGDIGAVSGPVRLEPGARFGPYQLDEEVARGGMGIIFRATHLNLGRVVALKVLSHSFASNAELVRRFIREAKALARLMHPNIVQVFNVGKAADTYFLEMEFVDGEDLHELIVRESPLPIDQVVEIGRQVVAALRAANEAGIVHRDVKPENILLSATHGMAKLTDFGIVKMAGSSSSDQSTGTRLGEVIGTPYYIAPEQARGEEDVDFRADIYSLGATIWRMITGHPPFEGRNAMEVIARHLNRPLPTPDELDVDMPQPVFDVLDTMMAKDPHLRYGSWDEVDEALERLSKLGGCPVCGSPMEPEHIICIECGFNRKTGVQLQTTFGGPKVNRTLSPSQKAARAAKGGGGRRRRTTGRGKAGKLGKPPGKPPAKAPGKAKAGKKTKPTAPKKAAPPVKQAEPEAEAGAEDEDGSDDSPKHVVKKRRRRRRR